MEDATRGRLYVPSETRMNLEDSFGGENRRQRMHILKRKTERVLGISTSKSKVLNRF